MTKAITIPMDLWEEDEEAVLTAWLVDNNSEVSTGQLLAEVMVEKFHMKFTQPMTELYLLPAKKMMW